MRPAVVAGVRGVASAARLASSAARSALIAAPAVSPAAAEVMTCAAMLARLPAAHTPGTLVAPEGAGYRAGRTTPAFCPSIACLGGDCG